MADGVIDATATVNRLRELMVEATTVDPDRWPEDPQGLLEAIAEAWGGLDRWMSMNGRMPQQWETPGGGFTRRQLRPSDFPEWKP